MWLSSLFDVRIQGMYVPPFLAPNDRSLIAMLSFHPSLFSRFLLVPVRVPVRVCSVHARSTKSQRFRDLVLGLPIPPLISPHLQTSSNLTSVFIV
jgi:hypothetical protein